MAAKIYIFMQMSKENYIYFKKTTVFYLWWAKTIKPGAMPRA